METASFSGLLNNATLLLALGLVYDALGLHTLSNTKVRDLCSGVLVGLVGIAVMSTPWELSPGIFFDTRWILLSLCGLYFGLIPTLVAVAITVGYRLFQGGAGQYVGSLVIIVTALIGLGGRRWLSPPYSWLQLYLFGVVVQLAFLACALLMPAPVRWTIIATVGPTVLALYPVGTMLLGLILGRQRERRRAEDELRVSREALGRERGLLRSLIDAIPDPIFYKDTGSRYLGCNQAFSRYQGRSEAELMGQSDGDLFGPEVARSAQAGDAQVIESGEPFRSERWVNGPEGAPVLLDTVKTCFYGDDGALQGVVGVSRDITALRHAEEVIWKQANFDPLTGLPNRSMFQDRLDQALRRARRTDTRVALLFLDLDNFKEVNDTLGHDTGDQLLKACAERLKGCVRDTDSIARLGGDEFNVVLQDLRDPKHAERVANQILATLARPYAIGQEQVYISTSVGVTFYPDDAEDRAALLRNADQAVYEAKRQGRNRLQYYTPEMQEAATHRMALANDLRNAVIDEQFVVHYQPIVELGSGRIHKAEALVRWQHPSRGMVSPFEFISLAEDIGMIIPIGNWVFHQATDQVSRWRERYHPEFQVSVNCSPVQFRDDEDRQEKWLLHLERRQLPGRSVVIEITEGLLMDATSSVSDKLKAYADADIPVALDDFGTGYSSLAYLKRFDIDYLKIDRAFVSQLSAESEDLALCEAIIVMAHKLGIKVIAEGIETDEQLQLLKEAGCDYGQGYLFSRPVNAEQFEALLAADCARAAS